ncbi:MAG: RES family NAD+ phosphorylase [Steroidobacteraceae bacterium]
MKLWRLYRRAHGPGLDGAGGRYAAGRWHHQGTPVVYFGAGAAIVVLEKLAHLNPDTLPADLILGLFEADVSVTDAWSAKTSPEELEDIEITRGKGQHWLASGTTCVLRVPSIVVPEEHNLVLNPQHAEARSIKMVSERAFVFDGRLL